MTEPDHGGTELLPPPRVGEGGGFVMGVPAQSAPSQAAGEASAGPVTVRPGQAADPRVAAPSVAVGRPEATDSAATASIRYAAAATATATATVAPPRAAPAAAPAAPAVLQDRPPPGGTVYAGRRADGAGPPVGRLHRLRIGSHTMTYPAAAQLGVPSPSTGLILGADRDRQPMPIRFFRPEPTKVSLVGEVWAAQVLAFRALALGARVVVITVEPAMWGAFGPWATGRNDRVAVLPGEAPLAVTGTAQQPMLLLYDLGVVGPTAPPELGPWQTQLTVLRQLRPSGVAALQGGDLVMLKRLTEPEAALSAGPLRLSAQSVQLLQVLENDMVALLGGGADRYVWLTLTGVERQLAARR
jgi:hypothetical protein